jgi:DNA-directed RNA polymerase specialized sigma24 family protein
MRSAPGRLGAWGFFLHEIEGRSSEDIAAALFVSPHTVRDHIKAIFGKVGVHNRRHLTAALTGQPGEATA